MKGAIWTYYLKSRDEMTTHSLFSGADDDIDLYFSPGGEDKFFAKKLMEEIHNNFSHLRDQYKQFLSSNGVYSESVHGSKALK